MHETFNSEPSSVSIYHTVCTVYLDEEHLGEEGQS